MIVVFLKESYGFYYQYRIINLLETRKEYYKSCNKRKKAKINLNEWEGNITFALIFLYKKKK